MTRVEWERRLLQTLTRLEEGQRENTGAIREVVARLDQHTEQFRVLNGDVRELKTDVRELKTDVRELKTDMREMKVTVAEHTVAIRGIAEELRGVNGRLDGVNARLDNVIDTAGGAHRTLGERVTRLEAAVFPPTPTR